MRTFLTGGATMSDMNIDIAWLLPEGYASRGIPGHCMRMTQKSTPYIRAVFNASQTGG